jgi:hypothetical protein
LFELVRPAAVVRPCLAAEQLDAVFHDRRVIVQEQQDLACQVGALEVVPIVLGCLDPVADEQERRVDDIDDLLLSRRPVGQRLVGLVVQLAVAVSDRQRRRGRVLSHARHLHRLEVRAGHRKQTDLPESPLDVRSCLVGARRSRPAAFHVVRR